MSDNIGIFLQSFTGIDTAVTSISSDSKERFDTVLSELISEDQKLLFDGKNTLNKSNNKENPLVNPILNTAEIFSFQLINKFAVIDSMNIVDEISIIDHSNEELNIEEIQDTAQTEDIQTGLPGTFLMIDENIEFDNQEVNSEVIEIESSDDPYSHKAESDYIFNRLDLLHADLLLSHNDLGQEGVAKGINNDSYNEGEILSDEDKSLLSSKDNINNENERKFIQSLSVQKSVMVKNIEIDRVVAAEQAGVHGIKNENKDTRNTLNRELIDSTKINPNNTASANVNSNILLSNNVPITNTPESGHLIDLEIESINFTEYSSKSNVSDLLLNQKDSLIDESVTDESHSLDVNDSNFTEDLDKIIRKAHTRGQTKLNIKLSPKNLGSLELELTEFGGKIKVRVVNATQEVKQILFNNNDTIKHTLAAKGIEIEEFILDMKDHQSGEKGQYKNGKDKRNYYKTTKNIKNAMTTEVLYKEDSLYA